MGNERTYDVCVVGSGITALVAAGIFAQKNFSVCVVAPPLREEIESGDIPPRHYSISASSRRIFELLQVWEEVNGVDGGLVRGIEVWGSASRPLIEFLPTIDRLSPLAWILERQNIVSVLLVAIRGLGVDIIESELISVACAEDTGLVHLESCELRASLIVGADGRNSKVRQSMGVSLVTKTIGQEAVVAVVKTEKSHQNFACQRFLQTGPIAFLP